MKIVTLLFALMLVLAACSSGPTAEQVEATVSARLTAAVPPATRTPLPTLTATIPPASPTPKPTNTPKPTLTPTLVPVGLFSNPAPIGTTVIRWNTIKTEELGCTVMEVRRGSDALELARSNLSYLFENPIQGQEYLAVKVKFDVKTAPENEAFSLYVHWHLTLRSSDGGNDLWSIPHLGPIKEDYPPYSVESWIFFLTRANADLLLYFQPDLMIDQKYGEWKSGAYFLLSK